MAGSENKRSMRDIIRHSPPLDLDAMLDTNLDHLRIGRQVIVITGGASGFGAAWLKSWAMQGAVVIIGDVNVEKGSKLVLDVRKETKNPNLHFIYCNVVDWQSQVSFFKEAVRLSPHGGIDTVIANAGIADRGQTFENPTGLDGPEPPAPNLRVLEVNLTGVIYTTHLALFYLSRNPGSCKADPNCDPASVTRDRHLLLVSSIAGLLPIPTQSLYGTSKHAVVGLFRNLRSTSFLHGIRVNMLTPYWIDTPIIGTSGRILLAGASMGKVEDVTEAASMFVRDPRIAGRCLCVGPKLMVEQIAEGGWELVSKEGEKTKQRAIWEVFEEDFEHPDQFQRRVVMLLNAAAEARGWYGWISDMIAAIGFGLKSLLRRWTH